MIDRHMLTAALEEAERLATRWHGGYNDPAGVMDSAHDDLAALIHWQLDQGEDLEDLFWDLNSWETDYIDPEVSTVEELISDSYYIAKLFDLGLLDEDLYFVGTEGDTPARDEIEDAARYYVGRELAAAVRILAGETVKILRGMMNED